MFVRRLVLLVLLHWILIPAGRPVLAGGSPGDCFVAEDDGWQCGHISRMASRLGGGRGGRGIGDPQPETPWTDVLHTKIDIEVDPTGRTVYGTVTITAASRIGALNEFVVYLEPNGGLMSVSGVGGNGTGHTHVGQKVTISLDSAYGIGEEFTVSLDYGGLPRLNDGIFWGSHDNGSEEVDIVATLSESWHARSWWVGKDALDDKSTFEIWVTVADHLVVASNGILRSDPPDPMPGSKLRYRWEEINPMIPYLASIAIADYEILSLTYDHLGDTMPMEFYMLPEVYTGWAGYCVTYGRMTEVFSDVYGQYPFVNEKGGMAHTPTIGAYMEHQTIPSMPNFTNEWVNAHELAHQWWGDLVTCETWGDIWLNEGITSFSEAIWEEFRPGGGTGEYFAHMAWRRPSNPDVRVYVTNVNSEGAIFNGNAVYRKGAWVTHMLRGVLGDETFFPAMLDYREAFAGDSATTDEFITSISSTAGYDLSFFTEQWVMSPGSPDYEYGWQHVQAAGQDYLLLQVEQTQGDRGYALMTMPLDIEVTTTLGTTTYVVWCSEEIETYAIPVDGAVQDVQLDPDQWILTHSKNQVTPGTIEPTCQGDMNGDGELNGLDVPQFISGLSDSSTWPGSWRRSDLDFSGRCDMDDLPLFVAALLTGCELP